MGEGEGEKRKEGRKEVSLLQLSPFYASIFPLFPPETPDTQASHWSSKSWVRQATQLIPWCG